MPRRIAYLCGMTYLDYDQTKKQNKTKQKSDLVGIAKITYLPKSD